MKIQYKEGNLIHASEDMLIHGCNAQGVMGSGVAKDIRQFFPPAYTHYKYFYDTKKLILGSVIWVTCRNKLIGNAITQEFYGRDNKQYVSYEAIKSCMQDVNNMCIKNNISTVAMPMIGAGLGGGNWNIISNIIEETLLFPIPIVYILKKSD